MSSSRFIGTILSILLAIFAYFYGIDSPHIPNIGDEFPYAHITRLTAESGHLLPLQSELDHMRNTKPPLLFWQGIAATHWGSEWTWFNLRYPSVIYTLLTALLIFLLARKIAQQQSRVSATTPTEIGWRAALIFLAFFSSYRYGRPFLVNPPEVFWFFLPFFTLLYWRKVAFDSRLIIPLLLGCEIGIGLLYKSFALIVPIGLALSWWYWHQRDYRLKVFLLRDAWKVAISLSLALAIFSLWFVFDPDPQAIWREFIVGENAGKFGAKEGGYFATLLWGGSSIWALLLGYPMNAGLLALPVAALFFVAYRRRLQMADDEKMLWIWMAAIFLIFCLPSQRTARYLLEAMPAVAILAGLNWQRIPRVFFVLSFALSAVILALLAYLSFRLEQEVGHLYGLGWILLLMLTTGFILLGLFSARFSRDLLSITAILVMLTLAVFLSPIDDVSGKFSLAAQQSVKGKDVWTPCNFRAVDEGYRFLLPGAKVHGYLMAPEQTISALSGKYNYFAVQLPMQEKCDGCQVIGRRLEIRNRHNAEDIKKIFKGEVYQQLFVNEWLLVAPAALPTTPLLEGCR